MWKNCIQIYVYKTLGILLPFKRSGCHKSPLSTWHVWTHLSIYMMTLSNGNIFRVTGHLCVEFTGDRWIPHTKASDAWLWCFFDLRLNKRVSKQSWGWWFETPSRKLWRHCNVDPKRDLAPLLMFLFRLDGTWCMFFSSQQVSFGAASW